MAGVLVNIYLWLAQPDVFWFWWNVTGFLTALSVSLGVYWLSHKKFKQPFIRTRQDVLTKTNMAALITWCVVLIGICIALPVMLIQ
jgi:cell division protein FtsX